LKHHFELIGLTLIAVFSAVFWMGADRVVAVPCGQDLDATVNADDPTIGTRFQLSGCNYTVDNTLMPEDGDEIAGPVGTFFQRGPGYDPAVSAKMVVGNNEAVGISNAHGLMERVELTNNTTNPDALGFNASGLKAVDEVEVKDSYIHDTQGNGLWCDEFCNDQPTANGKFWIHDNLVVNNGRAGIRFERVGDVADAGEALLENNEVRGNSAGAVHGGVSIHDAQNALVRNNVFGATTIADVAYLPNSEGVAIRATDSGRSDRPDLWNVDIVDNVLNGEVIKGCELPDEIVYCSEEAQPPPPLLMKVGVILIALALALVIAAVVVRVTVGSEAGQLAAEVGRSSVGEWPRSSSGNYNLDKLKTGEEVLLKDRAGNSYRYHVTEVFITDPKDVWVMGQVRGTDMVTLQTCTPYPTFQKRVIVRADRV
jgi:hypothetical protein